MWWKEGSCWIRSELPMVGVLPTNEKQESGLVRTPTTNKKLEFFFFCFLS